MRSPNGFESWESYREFVERSQRELFDPLYDAFQADALDLPEEFHSGPLLDDGTKLDPDWPSAFDDKWMDRDLHYADSVEYFLWHDDAMSPANGDVDPGIIGEQQEVRDTDFEHHRKQREGAKADAAGYSDMDDERYLYYEVQAPTGALATENYLDAASAFLAGLAQTTPEDRGRIYDATGDPSSYENTTAYFVVEWLFEPFDREAFVDGSAQAAAFEAQRERYEKLAPQTVWATSTVPTLAVDDENQPDGVGHPRTWTVQPSSALAGFEHAIDGPSDATATVTVEREYAIVTPTRHRLTQFRLGVVEESDDAFPASHGDEVLVAPANAVEPADGERARDDEGLTATQRAVVTTVDTDPDAVTTDEVDDLVTWATTAEPGPRARTSEALGTVAVDTGAEQRHVDALAEALADPELDVRKAAAGALHAISDVEPTAVAAATDALVDALDDDGDDTESIREDAAGALAALAAADASALRDHAPALCRALDERAGHQPGDTATVRASLAAALDDLREVGVDVFDTIPEAIITTATVGTDDERDPAKRTLVAALAGDDDGSVFDEVVDTATDVLVSNLEEPYPHKQHRAGQGLERLAALDPEIVVAVDVRDTLLALIRGEHHPGLNPNGTEPALRLLGALYETHPEYVLGDGNLPDALVTGRGEFDGVRELHATVLGRLGYHEPSVADAVVDPLFETATSDYHRCGPRDSAARALCMIGAADRSRLEGAIGDTHPSQLAQSVDAAMHHIYKTHQHSHLRSKAVQTASLAGTPVLTDDAWDRVTNGRTSTLPERRLAAVSVIEQVANTDRAFFADHGGFGWLRAVVTDDDDPRVAAEALRVLTALWVDDPEFVATRAVPLDEDTIAETDDGVVVEDVGGRTELSFPDASTVPEKTGVNVLELLVDALDASTRPAQLRVAEALEGLADDGNSDAAVTVDDVENHADVLGDVVDANADADWRERVLELLERAASEHPDRVRRVLDDLDPVVHERVERAMPADE